MESPKTAVPTAIWTSQGFGVKDLCKLRAKLSHTWTEALMTLVEAVDLHKVLVVTVILRGDTPRSDVFENTQICTLRSLHELIQELPDRIGPCPSVCVEHPAVRSCSS